MRGGKQFSWSRDHLTPALPSPCWSSTETMDSRAPSMGWFQRSGRRSARTRRGCLQHATASRCEVTHLPLQELGGVTLTKQHKSPPLVYLEPVNGTAGASFSLSLSPFAPPHPFQPHGSFRAQSTSADWRNSCSGPTRRAATSLAPQPCRTLTRRAVCLFIHPGSGMSTLPRTSYTT